MQLPESKGLEISKLSSIFSDTTNSYKFYWFLSILDSLQENGQATMSLNDIALRMVANVWYPLDFFKLSFGKQDSFKAIANFLTSKIEIDNSINSLPLFQQIKIKLPRQDHVSLKSKVDIILRWVPYRFLRVFFAEETKGLPDHQVNNRIIELANLYFKDHPELVIYKFSNDSIELNQIWIDYFQQHQVILRGFINWHLIKFVQKNNPTVIGLSEKLKKPNIRDLKQAYLFWKVYLERQSISCIYSGENVTLQNISLDH